jgi:hypothetical protein
MGFCVAIRKVTSAMAATTAGATGITAFGSPGNRLIKQPAQWQCRDCLQVAAFFFLPMFWWRLGLGAQ